MAAESGAVLDRRAALIAGMFHRSSRYSTAGERGKARQSDPRTGKTNNHEGHEGSRRILNRYGLSDRRPFVRAHVHQGKAGAFAIRIDRNDVLIVSAAHL